MSPSSPASWGILQYWLEKVQRAPSHLEYLQVSFGWVELVQIKSGLFTQNGSDSLKCIAAQHCLSNWRRFFILFPENKTFFQIKLFCTFMVWRDIFWISLLSSVFLVQLSNVSPQPAFCPNYDCSDCKIMELFLASSVPNSSDELIFVKRRALDGPFLDKNTGFRRAHRRAKFTFLIFFFLSKFAKKVKIEQNLFFSNAGQGGHHKIKCMEILRRSKLHLNVRRSSQAGSQWWIPSERAQNHI